MTRLFTLIMILSAASIANAQYDEGLPMSDSLGSGIYGLGGGGGGYTPAQVSPSVYTPTYRQPQNRGGFQGGQQGISPQQMQNIATAAAALGPAIQQARQNLQQIRAQNGGYLIPRNNNNGGLFGGGRIGNGRLLNRLANAGQRQPWQGMQRYTDTFGANDANRVRQALIQDGYNNVQVYEDPNNGWRRQQGMQPIYGVYHGQR